MPYYVDRKLISWLAPKEIHDLVTVIAHREDRSVSNYLRRLILEDLRKRGVVNEDGTLPQADEEDAVATGTGGAG